MKTIRFPGFGLSLITLLLALGAGRVSAQDAASTPAAQPTAAATPAGGIPYNEDPNVPGLSRAERIRRQESYIQKLLKQDEERRREETLKQIEGRLKEAAKNREENREKIKEQQGPAAPGGKPQAFVSPTPVSGPLNMEVKRKDGGALTSWAATFKERDTDEMGFRRVTLFMDPSSVVVRPNEPFNTRLKLISLDKTAVNRIDLHVYYPTGALRLISAHHDKLVEMIDGDPIFEIDRKRGYLHYEAKLKKPINSLDADLLTLRWAGPESVDGATISLGGPDGVSAAYFNDMRVTENEFGAWGGVVRTVVRVDPWDAGTIRAPMEANGSAADQFAASLGDIRDALDSAPPKLRLIYNKREVYRPGDWVVVDVMVDNESGAAADEIRLAMTFDPGLVEVIDTDRRNLAREGINALEGPFRASWGWTEVLRNHVDAKKGRLEYWVRADAPRPLPSGALTRVFLMIKRDTTDPLLKIENGSNAEPTAGEPLKAITSGFFLMGENLDKRYARAVAEGRIDIPKEGAAGVGKADPKVYREKTPRRPPQGMIKKDRFRRPTERGLEFRDAP